MNKIITIITFTFFSFLFHSCQNEAQWYPSADVTIISHYEYTNTLNGTRQIQITCVIHNTGITAINSGAVTLQVTTDKHEYLQTVAINTRIIPEGKIAVHAQVAYFESDEQLQDNGIAVYASYFD